MAKTSPLTLSHIDFRFPRGLSPLVTPKLQAGAFPSAAKSLHHQPSHQTDSDAPSPSRILSHVRLASDPMPHETPQNQQVETKGVHRASTMSLYPGMRPSALHIHPDQRSFSDNEHQDPSIITKTPRSPGPNKLTSFFGWKTSSPVAEVSPSSISARSHSPNQSPAPSPLSPSPHSFSSSIKPIPQPIDIRKANVDANASYFADTGFPLPPQNGTPSSHFLAMEEELREVSSELAGSIRRELELEDLIDRLQFEAQQGPDFNRRTSDYFSDSGTSSVRYPPSETGGAKTEDIAKLKRTIEQEKSQFKLTMSQKLQDERGRRRVLELHIQQLGDQVQHVGFWISNESFLILLTKF